MRCEECLPLIEEYVDGELEGRARERAEAHLSACADCGRELAELRREQEVYALYRRDVEVTAADWNIVRARIEQEAGGAVASERRPGPLAWLAGLFGPRNPFRSALVAALVIIVIGVTAVALYMNSRGEDGRNELASGPGATEATETPREVKETNPPQPGVVKRDNGAVASNDKKNSPGIQTPGIQTVDAPGTQTVTGPKTSGTRRQSRATSEIVAGPRPRRGPDRWPATAGGGGAQFVEAAAYDPGAGIYPSAAESGGDLDTEVARHAGRAQMLLRSFRNARPESRAGAADVSFEKEQSRRLLYQNIALRREASAHGDPASAELLDTLEPILLDIANLPARARARDLRPIERRMEKKEIVAALQVRTLLASN